MTGRKGRIVLLALAMGAAVFALVSVAGAASSAKNGVRLLSPKNKAVVPTVVVSGKTPTFKIRVRGKGVVYYRVCKSKKRDNQGQLCRSNPNDIDRGKKGKKTKKGRYYTFTPGLYTFPSYYLNTPGTYYWQAYRIACKDTRSGKLDCIQESSLRKFTVK